MAPKPKKPRVRRREDSPADADWRHDYWDLLLQAAIDRESGDSRRALADLDAANSLYRKETGEPPPPKKRRPRVRRLLLLMMHDMVERGRTPSDAARWLIRNNLWKGQGGSPDRQPEALLASYRKMFAHGDTKK